jgi:single-strand DNA-binding protein
LARDAVSRQIIGLSEGSTSMADLNCVMLIGRLTRDPELRSIREGTSVCKFGLATNEHFKKADGEDGKITCFVDVEAWGRLGQVCSQYLRKGRELFVSGRLRFSSWEAPGGGKRSKLTVQARQIQFLGGRLNGNGDGATEAPKPAEEQIDEESGELEQAL